MRVSELIKKLQDQLDVVGDVEVLITDGFQAECYRGDYAVELFVDVDGYSFIDIGIGGCAE
jgi:hypothetical protein